MRILSLVLALLFFGNFGQAQYFVIKVEGKVYANDVLLKPRDQVKPEMNLKFEDAKAYAHVLSTTKGHFILNGQKGIKNRKGEFFAALKDAIFPPDQFQVAATRGEEDIASNKFEDKYDLKAFFRDQIIVITDLRFQINAKKYSLDEDHYFELRHQAKRKSYQHRLNRSADDLIIDRQMMLKKPNGKDISKRILSSSLIYVNKAKGEEEVFGPFYLRFLSNEQLNNLESELKMLHQMTEPKSTADFRKKHLIPYLHLHYGKMSAAEMSILLKKTGL